MSTRANIGIKQENGTYLMVYCHYDGYPSHVGEILSTFHDSYSRANELLRTNSIRQFRNDGSVERFDDGEAEVYFNLEEALNGFDYAYVYIEKWICYTREMMGIKEIELYDYS
jgi:hypothetical protein